MDVSISFSGTQYLDRIDGVIDDKLVLSKTSGTSEYETGTYDIFLNDIIYSANSNIAAKVTSISPYRDPIVSINLVRPVGSTSGSWSSFEEGDKFVQGFYNDPLLQQ